MYVFLFSIPISHPSIPDVGEAVSFDRFGPTDARHLALVPPGARVDRSGTGPAALVCPGRGRNPSRLPADHVLALAQMGKRGFRLVG